MELNGNNALPTLANHQVLPMGMVSPEVGTERAHLNIDPNFVVQESVNQVMCVQINMDPPQQNITLPDHGFSADVNHAALTTALQGPLTQGELEVPVNCDTASKEEDLSVFELINGNVCSQDVNKDNGGSVSSSLWAAASELQAILWNNDQNDISSIDTSQIQAGISNNEQISIDVLEPTLNVEVTTEKMPEPTPISSPPELTEVSNEDKGEGCFRSAMKEIGNEGSLMGSAPLSPMSPTEGPVFPKPRTMCIAPGCNNDRKQFKIDKKPFHWVPKDHLRAMLWYQALGIGPAESDAIQKKCPYPLVCCDHFSPEDYEGNTESTPRPLRAFVRKRQLKKDVIPKPTGHLKSAAADVQNPPVFPSDLVSAYTTGTSSTSDSTEDVQVSVGSYLPMSPIPDDLSSPSDNPASTTAVFNERFPLPCTKPVSACIAPGCPNTRYNMHKVNETRKDPHNVLSFHQVPKDRQQAVLWYEALCLCCPEEDSLDKATSRYVCSDHFSADDFEGNANLALQLGLEPPKRQLKKGAVPRLEGQPPAVSSDNEDTSSALQEEESQTQGLPEMGDTMSQTTELPGCEDNLLIAGSEDWLDDPTRAQARLDTAACMLAVPAQAEPIVIEPIDDPEIKIEGDANVLQPDPAGSLQVDMSNLLSGRGVNRIQDKRNRCLKCQRHFQNQNRLAAHERTCNKLPGKNNGMHFVCPKCEQQFQFSGHYAIHLRTCEKAVAQQSWKCGRCKQVFLGHSYYEVHQARCQEPLYKCLTCDRTFVSEQVYITHKLACGAGPNIGTTE